MSLKRNRSKTAYDLKAQEAANNVLLSKVQHKILGKGKQAIQTFRYMQRMNTNINSDMLFEKRKRSQMSQVNQSSHNDSMLQNSSVVIYDESKDQFLDSQKRIGSKAVGKALFVYKNDINKQFQMRFKPKDKSVSPGSRSRSNSKPRLKSPKNNGKVMNSDFRDQFLQKKCNSPIDKYLSQSLSGTNMLKRDRSRRKSFARQLEEKQTVAETLRRTQTNATFNISSSIKELKSDFEPEPKDIFLQASNQPQQRAASAVGTRPRRSIHQQQLQQQRQMVQSAIAGKRRYRNHNQNMSEQFVDLNRSSSNNMNNFAEQTFSTKVSRTNLSQANKNQRNNRKFNKSKSIASFKHSVNGKSQQDGQIQYNQDAIAQYLQKQIIVDDSDTQGSQYIKNLINNAHQGPRDIMSQQTSQNYLRVRNEENLEDVSFLQPNSQFMRDPKKPRRQSSVSQFKQPNFAKPTFSTKQSQSPIDVNLNINLNTTQIADSKNLISTHIQNLKVMQSKRKRQKQQNRSNSKSPCSACNNQPSEFYQKCTHKLSNLSAVVGRNTINMTQQNPPLQNGLMAQGQDFMLNNFQIMQNNIMSEQNLNQNDSIQLLEVMNNASTPEQSEAIQFHNILKTANFGKLQTESVASDNGLGNLGYNGQQEPTGEQDEATELLNYLKEQRRKKKVEKIVLKTEQQKVIERQHKLQRKQEQKRDLEKSLDLLHAYGEFDRFVKTSKNFMKQKGIKTKIVKQKRSSSKATKFDKKPAIPVFRNGTQVNSLAEVENNLERHHWVSSQALTPSDFANCQAIKSFRKPDAGDQSDDEGEEDQIIYRHSDVEEVLSGFEIGKTDDKRIIEEDQMFSEAIRSIQKQQPLDGEEEAGYNTNDIKHDYIRETDREQQFTNIGHSSRLESNHVKDSTHEDENQVLERSKVLSSPPDSQLENAYIQVKSQQDIQIKDESLEMVKSFPSNDQKLAPNQEIEPDADNNSEKIEPLNISAIQKQIDLQLSNQSMSSPKAVITSMRSVKSPLSNKNMVDYLDQEIQIVLTKSSNSIINQTVNSNYQKTQDALPTTKMQQLANDNSASVSVKSHITSKKKTKETFDDPYEENGNKELKQSKVNSVTTSLTDNKAQKYDSRHNSNNELLNQSNQDKSEKGADTIKSTKQLNKITVIESNTLGSKREEMTYSDHQNQNDSQFQVEDQGHISAEVSQANQNTSSSIDMYKQKNDSLRPDSPTPRNIDERGIDYNLNRKDKKSTPSKSSQASRKTQKKSEEFAIGEKPRYSDKKTHLKDKEILEEPLKQNVISEASAEYGNNSQSYIDKKRSETELIQSNNALNLKTESIINLEIQISDLENTEHPRKAKPRSLKTQNFADHSNLLIKEQQLNQIKHNEAEGKIIKTQISPKTDMVAAELANGNQVIAQNSFGDNGEDDEEFYDEEPDPSAEYPDGHSIDTQERIRKMQEFKQKNHEQYLDMKNSNLANVPIVEITARREYSQRSKSKADSYSNVDVLTQGNKSFNLSTQVKPSLRPVQENEEPVQRGANNHNYFSNLSSPEETPNFLGLDSRNTKPLIQEREPIINEAVSQIKSTDQSYQINEKTQMQTDEQLNQITQKQANQKQEAIPKQSTTMLIQRAEEQEYYDEGEDVEYYDEEDVGPEDQKEEYNGQNNNNNSEQSEQQIKFSRSFSAKQLIPGQIPQEGDNSSSLNNEVQKADGTYSVITMGNIQSNLKKNTNEPISEISNEMNGSSPSEKERSAEFVLQPNQLNQQIYNQSYQNDNIITAMPKRHQTAEESKLVYVEDDEQTRVLQNQNSQANIILLQNNHDDAPLQTDENNQNMQRYLVQNQEIEGQSSNNTNMNSQSQGQTQNSMDYGEEGTFVSQSYYDEQDQELYEQQRRAQQNQQMMISQSFEQDPNHLSKFMSQHQNIDIDMGNVKVIQSKPYMFDNGESYMGQGEEDPSRLGQGEEEEWSYYDEEEEPDQNSSIYTNNQFQNTQQEINDQNIQIQSQKTNQQYQLASSEHGNGFNNQKRRIQPLSGNHILSSQENYKMQALNNQAYNRAKEQYDKNIQMLPQ